MATSSSKKLDLKSTGLTDYAAFKDKVKRTVYIDNLSPQVTEAVLRAAIDQFGSVLCVRFIPNYTETGNIPQCALIEMKDEKQAKNVVSTICQTPFMISGMPRPVRARPAEIGMFDDRPTQPGRVINFHWLDSKDPDFQVAKQMKHLIQRHSAETSFVLKHQLDQEEKLHKQQEETLKKNYKKYEMITGIIKDKSLQNLAEHYRMRVSDD